MSKKLKIVLALAAGVVILSLGTGAVVMAASNTTTPPATTTPAAQCKGLFTAAAAALGVTEQQLADAFQQAAAQVQQQSITAALAQAVTNGTISQAESNAIQAWLTKKPTSPTPDNMKAWEAAKPQLSNPDAWKTILGFPGKGMGPAADNTAFLTRVVAILNAATGKSITAAQLQAALTPTEANKSQTWQNQPPPGDKQPGSGPGWAERGFGGMMHGKDFRGMPQQPAPPATTGQPKTY
jgi:hypothetical protein